MRNHRLAATLAASIVIGLCFLSPAVRADWDTFQNDAVHTGYVPGTYNFANAAIQWHTVLPSPLPVNGLAVGDGTVLATNQEYFSSYPTFHALDQVSGAILWSKAYGTSNDSTSAPAYANGIAYVQTDGQTYGIGNYLNAYNVRTGAAVYNAPYQAQFETYLNPTPYSGNVYTGGGYYGGMYSFKATPGTQNWFGSVPQYDGWTPAVNGQYAYAYTGSGDTTPIQGVFTVLNLSTGVTAASVVDPVYNWTGYTMNSAVVLGTHNDAFTINGNRLVSWDTALDATHTPHIAWSLTDGYSGQPTLANGRLYVVDNGGLSALDELTGNPLWSWQPASGTLTGPMIATDNLIFAQTPGDTYAIDLTSHSLVWSTGVSGTMAFSDGTLYIGDSNGVVYAFSSVPEPGTLVLLTAAGGGGCLLRRRIYPPGY